MFKLMAVSHVKGDDRGVGVRGISHVQCDGGGLGASAMFKVMGGGEGHQPFSR